MVKAWYMDNDFSDQRLEHHRNPPEYLSLENLYKKTGVEYFNINVNTFTTDGVLDKIKKDRGYTYEDEIVCSKECLPNYEEKIKSFFEEHLHTGEEIRLVLDGSGYFDVRDGTDQWIRIAVSAGDMIVIPSGIYHRFTLDTNNFIKAKRFFIGEPVWLPYNRPAEDLPCREQYLHKLEKGFVGFIGMAEGIIIFALWYIALAYNYYKENFCDDNKEKKEDLPKKHEVDDTDPEDIQPDDTEPGDAEPDDAEPDDAEPDDAEPDDAEPGDAEPGDAEPGDAEPDDAEPDAQPELTPTKESDFIIRPIDEKKDSIKSEDSPTVEDIVTEVQDFVAVVEDNLDKIEEA